MFTKDGAIHLDEGDILLRERLIKFPSRPDENIQLIGSRCKKCGDLSFPAKFRCGKCDGKEKDLEEKLLGPRGEIFSYTIVHQAVPGYQVPNIVAIIKFPEDDTLMVLSQIKDCRPEEIRCGLAVEAIVADLFVNQKGQKIIGYAFRPVKEKKK